ncbi:MAG: TetR/AcrR family transcriptional regulator [Gemmatimonadetes bacterium]|nr:TetR/AcrR family transcriptional regulator [Gemmatimonadota bacterium]
MDNRDKLLLAASRIYAEVGFRGATTRRIADEAGVNEVTLFRLFGSKAQLIAEAISCQDPMGTVSLPEHPVDPLRELAAWCDGHTVVLREMRAMIRKRWPIWRSTPKWRRTSATARHRTSTSWSATPRESWRNSHGLGGGDVVTACPMPSARSSPTRCRAMSPPPSTLSPRTRGVHAIRPRLPSRSRRSESNAPPCPRRGVARPTARRPEDNRFPPLRSLLQKSVHQVSRRRRRWRFYGPAGFTRRGLDPLARGCVAAVADCRAKRCQHRAGWRHARARTADAGALPVPAAGEWHGGDTRTLATQFSGLPVQRPNGTAWAESPSVPPRRTPRPISSPVHRHLATAGATEAQRLSGLSYTRDAPRAAEGIDFSRGLGAKNQYQLAANGFR